MPKSMRSVTMKDVARQARVSQTTVSLVLNDKAAEIPAGTRQRVWEAVEALGYRPNALAQGLRRRRSHVIGLLSDDLAHGPQAGRLLAGALAAARLQGKILLPANTGGDPDLDDPAVESMLARKAEGIIYACMQHRAAWPPEALQEAPAVLLNCFSPQGSHASVVPDEAGLAHAAVDHLLQRGHRRIGFINTPKAGPAGEDRLAGYQAALAAQRLPWDDSLVYSQHGAAEGGCQGTTFFLSLPKPPSAIFCFDDLTALGAYQALKSHGLRIPQDVAMIAVESQENLAENLQPALTGLELPYYEMGRWAIDYLVAQIEDPQAAQLTAWQHKMPCRLIQRGST